MNLKLVLNSLKSDRQELDVPPLRIVGFSALLTLVIYLLMLPFKSTYVGILLYERGFTQVLVIAFASYVLVFLALKIQKIRRELNELKKEYFPPTLSAFKPTEQGVSILQTQLGKESNLLARRCGRVLGAYIYSGSRQVATDFAVEDANFYQTKSESSYTFPRILIWAIPLLGFIGTVMGISAAVNGFSQFLNQSSDVSQIKEGIGTVTNGLAIAFDTTLLALLFSVLVMIPLVLVERQESRLLLGIDIYINDKILPRFQEKATVGGVDEESLRDMIDESIQAALPSHEALIEPAQSYAEEALSRLTGQFIQALQPVQAQVHGFLTQFEALQQTMQGDRQNLITQFEALQQTMQGDRRGFLASLPSAEALIQPAQIYAEQAAQNLAQGFAQNVQPIQTQVEGLLNQLALLQTSMQADRQGFLARLPNAEALIQPAQIYTEKATQTLAQSFTEQVEPLQGQVLGLLTQIETLRDTLQGDRQSLQETVQTLIASFEAKIPSAEALIKPAQIYAEQAAKGFIDNVSEEMGAMQTQVQQIIRQFDDLQVNLREDRESLNAGLQQAAIALQERVEQLAKYSAEVNEVSQLQSSLEQTLKTLKEKATLEAVLEEIQATLQKLKPSLEQISKPRRITLIEKED
ncbi:MAG: MotA/TolQ/ExbB proton channel family protein [Synechocystis sp.]